MKLTAAVASLGAIAVTLSRGWQSWMWRRFDNESQPGIRKSGTDSVNDRTASILMALTEAVVGTSIERTHYEKYFAWRAENVLGFKALYEKFTRDLNQEAQGLAGRDFVDCDLNTRRRIAVRIFASDTWQNFLNTLRGKQGYQLYREYILSEILKLFSRTDAWILLGYNHWPGEARGLEAYTEPPSQRLAPERNL